MELRTHIVENCKIIRTSLSLSTLHTHLTQGPPQALEALHGFGMNGRFLDLVGTAKNLQHPLPH